MSRPSIRGLHLGTRPALNWSEVTWLLCSMPSSVALAMTYGLIAVDAAVGELPRDGERVEHRGASHLASDVYEGG